MDEFQEFKSLYLDKKWDESISWLEQNKAKLNPAVYHYNLGTIYLKKADYSLSRYHLELSKEIGLNTVEVQTNIKFVKENLKADRIEDSDFYDSIPFKLHSISNDWLMSIFLILVLISMVVYKKLNKKYLAITLIVLGLLPITFRSIYLKDSKFGVILKETSIHEGPSEIFSSSINAKSGIKVMVNKDYDDWVFITNPSSMAGWIKKQDLGILE